MNEAPLDVVARIARETVVPSFRDGLLMIGAMSWGFTLAYVVERGAHRMAERR